MELRNLAMFLAAVIVVCMVMESTVAETTPEPPTMALETLSNFYLSQMRYDHRKKDALDRCAGYWNSLNNRMIQPFKKSLDIDHDTPSASELALFDTVVKYLQEKSVGDSSLYQEFEECAKLLADPEEARRNIKAAMDALTPAPVVVDTKKEQSMQDELNQLRQRVAEADKERSELESGLRILAEIQAVHADVADHETLEVENVKLEAELAALEIEVENVEKQSQACTAKTTKLETDISNMTEESKKFDVQAHNCRLYLSRCVSGYVIY